MIKKMFLMLLVLVGGMMESKAWTQLEFHFNGNSTWSGSESYLNFTDKGANPTNNSEEIFELYLNSTNGLGEGDIYFRLHYNGYTADMGPTSNQIFNYDNGISWALDLVDIDWSNNNYIKIPQSTIKASEYRILVYAKSDNKCYIVVDIVSMPVKIAEGNDYATFSCDRALNFPTGDDAAVKAYTASISDDSKVKMTRITGAVPANTGLFIAGASANVPVLSSADAITGNLLHAGTGAAVGSDNCYVLVKRDGVYGFAKVASTHVTAKGKAYLQTDETLNAPSLGFYMDDDETTTIHSLGIENANTQDGVMYNLAGQRIDQPTKGIYIVNGRKVIVK